jgi:hypothetical protein
MGTNYISSKNQNPNKISFSFVVQSFHLSQLNSLFIHCPTFSTFPTSSIFFSFFWKHNNTNLTRHVLGTPKSNLMAREDRSFSYRPIGLNPKSFSGPGVPNSPAIPQASPWSNYLHPLFKF